MKKPHLITTNWDWTSTSRLGSDKPNYLGENDEMLPSHLRNWGFSSYFAPSPTAIEGWTIAIVAKNSSQRDLFDASSFTITSLTTFFTKEFIFMRRQLHTMQAHHFPSHTEFGNWTFIECQVSNPANLFQWKIANKQGFSLGKLYWPAVVGISTPPVLLQVVIQGAEE